MSCSQPAKFCIWVVVHVAEHSSAWLLLMYWAHVDLQTRVHNTFCNGSPNVRVLTGYSSICITEVTQPETSALLTVPYSNILFNLWSFCIWRSNSCAHRHGALTAWPLFKGPFVQGALCSGRSAGCLLTDRFHRIGPDVKTFVCSILNSCCSWTNSHWICRGTIWRGLCQHLGLALTRQVMQLNKVVLLSLLTVFWMLAAFWCLTSDADTKLIDVLLPMQLYHLGLTQNMLVGTLPESWSKLANVSSLSWKHMLLIHGAANLKAAALPSRCLHIVLHC